MDVVKAALLRELLRDVVEEMRHRAEEGCTGTHDVTCCGEDSDTHPEGWCHRCLMGVAARVLASLPAPAAPVIVVQVPDGWRVAQWDGQRYVSIGLPYPTERQANSDCALMLARVQPTVESRLP